jgi:hypothetical protein
MKHSLPHSLGLETARKVVRSAFETYSQRFSEFAPRTTWSGDDMATVSFSAKGMSIQGTVLVRATSIDVDLEVPFLLRPFQGKAVEVLERELQKWIHKASSGELS